jgi:uncharacterized protein (TIGR04255 family)
LTSHLNLVLKRRPISFSAEDGRLPVGTIAAPLPEFDRPPVTEVALAIQFEPLATWRAVHAGLYWGEVKDTYPQNETHPALPSAIERFDGVIQQQIQSVNIVFGDADTARFWFLTPDKTKLIQIQRDRLIINWRKIIGDEIYPRYSGELRPRLLEEWTRFSEFAKKQNLGDLKIVQCEVTYLNDIAQGEGWNTLSEALTLFSPWWGDGTDGWLPTPELANVTGSFRLPNDLGRLHFATQNLLRSRDQKQVVQFRLGCRGKPVGDDIDSIATWMDLAREWVVRGFSDITSRSAHVLWGRTR